MLLIIQHHPGFNADMLVQNCVTANIPDLREHLRHFAAEPLLPLPLLAQQLMNGAFKVAGALYKGCVCDKVATGHARAFQFLCSKFRVT